MSWWTRFFGLHARLIAAFSAMAILVTFSFSWAIKWRGKHLAEAALVKRASGITEVLAKLTAPAAAQGNSQELQRLLSFVQDYPDLGYVTVLGAKGEILARWSPSPLRPGEEFLEEAHSPRVVWGEGANGMVHVLAPVRAGDVHLGTVVTGVSRQFVQQILHTVQSTLLSVAVAVLLLAVLAALLLARNLQRPIRVVAARLSQLSQDLVDSARSQESAGTQQAGGIEQTRRTMERVLGSAQQIAEKSSQVLGNAERTVMGNRAVAVRIKELNGQSERAGELLGAIMQVADRTDLLALNAALEGTKAGEAGRGFTLVAAEMRRLAESTMESVNSIRQLMNDMRTASHEAVQAGHEGVALSEETTRSARDIALETQQQRKATEEVGRSMDDMAASVSDTMTRTRLMVSHAAELAQAASKLTLLMGGGATPTVNTGQKPTGLAKEIMEGDRTP